MVELGSKFKSWRCCWPKELSAGANLGDTEVLRCFLSFFLRLILSLGLVEASLQGFSNNALAQNEDKKTSIVEFENGNQIEMLNPQGLSAHMALKSARTLTTSKSY